MAYSSSSSPNLKPGAASPFQGGTSPNPNQNHNPNPSPGRGCQPLEFLPLRPTSVRAVPSPDGYCTYPWEPCRRAKSEWVSGGGIDVNRIPQDCHESSSPHSVLSSGPSSAFLKRDRGSKRERVREREGEREKTSESSDQEQRGGWEISSQGVGGRGGGGGSDEDEGVGGGSSSRKKLRLSKEQSALLEKSFRDQSTLNTKQKNTLAAHLNLTPRQVEVWFQNRRARTKLKQTEIDCEFLRRRYESLTEQNRRLQREVQELRAIKVAPPCIIAHDYYMPMPMPVPAATLTVCPSCQRLATMDNNRTLGLPRQQPPPSATC